MKRPDGKTIAVIIALLFVALSAAVSVGVVIHGIHSLSDETPASVSREVEAARETREQKKLESKREKAQKKDASETTTKKTTTKKTTAKKTTAKKTTAKKTTTKKTTAKKTTVKKTTTKKTTKKTTQKTTVKADGSKVIYLTFDDGPGPYTDKLLGILDEYDVKATFFVTGVYSKYQGCIAKEARAGHAVGVHSYSHEYSQIYKSESAYWADFNRMNEIVKQQTGKATTLFRFPGGSSNTVSERYNEGIMTRLTKQAKEKGLTYVDWNVYDGDAGETTSSQQVYKNIISGVQNQKKSIVLCHDVKSYTVNAMPKTIEWCLDHGYTFEVLTPGGFTVHHDVNN